MPPKKQGKYRFTDYEIDLSRRTVARLGHPIALSPRTFDLLAILVVNGQRVVAKEELMRVLGSDDAIEESNLAQHIFLLQNALKCADPGEKLILRIPGLGYKFTAPITELPPDPEPAPTVLVAPDPPAEPEEEHGPQIFPRFAMFETEEPVKASASRSRAQTTPETDSDSEPDPQPGLLSRLNHPLPLAAILLAIILPAGGGWFAWQRLHHAPRQSDQASLRLILASFQNSTGDPTFDQSLKTALTLDLMQSPYLSVPPESRIEETLAALKIPANQPVSPATAHQLCQQLDAQQYLTADIRRLTHNYLVTVQAFDCATGKDRAESRGIADSPDAVVSVLDKVAADLRKQLGESSTSVASFSKPLFHQRPASLAALKAYADAAHLALEGKAVDAIQLFQRATFLDPKFALAFSDLSALQANLGHPEEAAAALTKAYNLRETVDDQHRFMLISAYHDRVTGDLPAGLHNDKQWAAQYPRNPFPLTHQADIQIQLGMPVLALEPARRALALNPANPGAYIILARAQMHLGQFEEAAATCQQAIERQLDGVEIHKFLLQIAFLRLDQPAIDEQLAWAKGKPEEPEMQLQQAEIAFAEGRATAGKTIFQSVADTYRKQNQIERATEVLAQLPRIQAELGLFEAASSQLDRLPDSINSPEVPVAWAYTGEAARATTILKGQLASHPTGTLWQQSWAPQIRAAIALNQHQPQGSIDTLAPTAPSDQMNFDLSSFAVPALRGRAYLALKQPVEAEAEFHKILDHPGIQPLSHNYPLAQLGVARSLDMQGKTTEAGFAYKIVLQIWKQADPEFPRLKDAKAEYAHLNSPPAKAPTKPKRR